MDMIPDFLQHFAAGLDITNLPKAEADSAAIQNVLNVVLVIAGAVAVLVGVLAGVRLILSRGNPGETAQARNAIIVSLIGLIVIMFAFSIVNFVVFRVT